MKKIALLFIIILVLVGSLVFIYSQKNNSKNSAECGSEYIYAGVKHSQECACSKKKSTHDLFGGTMVYCDGLCGECTCFESHFNAETNSYGEKLPVSCPLEL